MKNVPFPARKIIGWSALLLLLLPTAAVADPGGPEPFIVSDSSWHQWNASFPEPESEQGNLSMDIRVEEYRILGDSGPAGESSSQSIVIRTGARVERIRADGTPEPVERIIASEVRITDVSKNLDIIPIVRNFNATPVDTDPFQPLRSLEQFCRTLDYFTIGCPVPRQGGDSQFSRVSVNYASPAQGNHDTAASWSPAGNLPDTPVVVSWDHRTGFPDSVASRSSNSIELKTRTKNLDNNREYSGTYPASFSYSGSVVYCESDLIAGFCPGTTRQMTRTLILSRPGIPASSTSPDPSVYSFFVTGAESRVENAR